MLVAAVAAVGFVVVRRELVAHGDITRSIDVGADFADRAEVPHGVTVVPGSGYDSATKPGRDVAGAGEWHHRFGG
ncbi:MAG TPA: hypothetical protein VK386_07180 [Acidimicrobiales bacterium]|nr:hypothetical protein [Acidimicrobiales bacterium]